MEKFEKCQGVDSGGEEDFVGDGNQEKDISSEVQKLRSMFGNQKLSSDDLLETEMFTSVKHFMMELAYFHVDSAKREQHLQTWSSLSEVFYGRMIKQIFQASTPSSQSPTHLNTSPLRELLQISHLLHILPLIIWLR